MEIKYHKGFNRRYMIFDVSSYDRTGYEAEMLRTKRVPNILPFYTVELENGIQNWYDITRKTSLKDLTKDELRKTGIMSADALIQRLRSMISNISSVYLIDKRNFYVSLDTVFVDEGGEIYLTYYPPEAENSKKDFQKFASNLGVELAISPDSIGMINGDVLVKKIKNAQAYRKEAHALPLQADDIIRMINEA